MFNYKRLSFVLFIVILFFILTDSYFERKLKVNLWSLFNVAVSESQEFSDSAPDSLMENFEQGRLTLNKYTNNWVDYVDKKMDNESSYKYFGLLFVSIILNLIALCTGYIIIFYPLLILLIYLFLTSNIFKKEEYPY